MSESSSGLGVVTWLDLKQRRYTLSLLLRVCRIKLVYVQYNESDVMVLLIACGIALGIVCWLVFAGKVSGVLTAKS